MPNSPDPDPYADPDAGNDTGGLTDPEPVPKPNPFSSSEASRKADGGDEVPPSWPPRPTPADDTKPGWYDIPAGANFNPENAEAVTPPAKPFQAAGADVYADGGAVGEDYLRHATDK